MEEEDNSKEYVYDFMSYVAAFRVVQPNNYRMLTFVATSTESTWALKRVDRPGPRPSVAVPPIRVIVSRSGVRALINCYVFIS